MLCQSRHKANQRLDIFTACAKGTIVQRTPKLPDLLLTPSSPVRPPEENLTSIFALANCLVSHGNIHPRLADYLFANGIKACAAIIPVQIRHPSCNSGIGNRREWKYKHAYENCIRLFSLTKNNLNPELNYVAYS